jgi:hypothetical protein
MIRAYEKMEQEKLEQLGRLSPRALFEVTKGKTPPEVRKQVAEMVDRGEKVSAAEVAKLRKENEQLKIVVDQVERERDEAQQELLAQPPKPSKIAHVMPSPDEGLYETFCLIWKRLDPRLRVRFWSEHKTPMGAPRSAMGAPAGTRLTGPLGWRSAMFARNCSSMSGPYLAESSTAWSG